MRCAACVTGLVLLTTALHVYGQDGDPCSEDRYTVLKGQAWRSTGYDVTDQAECDRRLSPAWYRVDSPAGNDMPVTCPAENKCGTFYPVWMKGTIPKQDGKIHNREAHINVEGDCSFKVVNIKVKNCGEYRVWQLQPLDVCAAAYCFGNQSPCPDGSSSETGFSPCKTDFPPQTQKPVLAWQVGQRSRGAAKVFKPGVVFTCKLPDPSRVPGNVLLDVEWYARGPGERQRERLYPPRGQKQLVTRRETALLHENDIYTLDDARKKKPTPIGKHFSCSIRARFTEDGTPSPFIYSDEFFVGVEILTPKLTIREGDEANIDLRPTIPIFNRGKTVTVISFGLVLPEYQRSLATCRNIKAGNEQLVLEGTDCAVKVTGITYNRATWTTDYAQYKNKKFTIPVRVKIDDKYGERVMSVKFRITEAYLTHPIWSYYTLPDIQVLAIDRDIDLKGKLCTSRNDPHMTTFDRRPYENHNQGEFILYKHKIIPVQVNAFYKQCNRVATCNCAVAVRSGKDVFIVDQCRAGKGVVKDYQSGNALRVGVIGCDRKGMTVFREGNKYTVTLPTGTQVIVSISGKYLEISVKPSVLDFGQTEGLCGTLNNNKNDDFLQRHKDVPDPVTTHPNAFSISWRVGEAESLYNGMKAEERYSWHTYCSCAKPVKQGGTGTVECSYDGVADSCMRRGTRLSRKAYQNCGFGRRRRSASNNLEGRNEEPQPEFVFEYDKDFVPPEPVWSNGWTEVKAREFCENYIMGSATGKVCSEHVPNVDMDRPIDNCIKDILLAGGTEWKGTALESARLQCDIELNKNTTLWTKDPETGYLKLPTAIMNQMCPENCSGRGVCEDGTCHCDDGYGGEDCTKDLNLAPTNVFSIRKVCRKEQEDCDFLPVFGEGFIESDKLSCKLQRCKITSGESHCSSLPHAPVEYEHMQRVNCQLPGEPEDPHVYGEVFYASVSNNGQLFSDEVVMTVYDSHCYECKAEDLTCTLKDKSCIKTSSSNSLKAGVLLWSPVIDCLIWTFGVYLLSLCHVGSLGGGSRDPDL